MKKIVKKNNRMIQILVGGVFLASLFLFGTHNWGKYVSRQVKDEPVKAVEMFFTSDLLKAASSSTDEYDYIVSEWEPGETIKFELRNYPDSQRFTNRPIHYTVSTDYSGTTFRNEEGPINSTTGKTDSLILPASDTKENHRETTIEIELDRNFLDGVDSRIVTVTAQASKPYVQEITAKFRVEKAATGFKVAVKDAQDSPFVRVSVTAEESRNLMLIWDDGQVVPDQTNPLFYEKVINNYSGANTDPYTKEISLGTINDTGAIDFYLMKYNEDSEYGTGANQINYEQAFKVIDVQGGG
ncbi:hypothetical protein [Enterococcus sp. AZ109]|uniref:hypothetical protein n=1 Tax=Enterococcus sp. AZ109 TaxID=2774634 RepID=UPI003F246DBE